MKLVLLAALVAALAAPAALAGTTALTGTDGPGFTITLQKGTAKVTRLKAGTYTLRISDKSNIHNFHLAGPGVNKKTGVGFVGKVLWRLKLKKGTYTFVCDPHKTIMHGSFKVT